MKFQPIDQRAYLASMRACALRWRMRKSQVEAGQVWAMKDAKEMLESAIWYREYLNHNETR